MTWRKLGLVGLGLIVLSIVGQLRLWGWLALIGGVLLAAATMWAAWHGKIVWERAA